MSIEGETTYKKYFKFLAGITVSLLFRLIPFRAPNVEPLLSFQMPYGKLYGPIASFMFGAVSITLYDVVTGRVGIWTLITAFAYGTVGVLSYLFFKNRSASIRNYVSFAILGTIFYDAITGLTIGPIFFHESFTAAFIGQIPFTALHLIGNISFACTLSPIIHYFLVKKREPRASFISIFNHRVHI